MATRSVTTMIRLPAILIALMLASLPTAIIAAQSAELRVALVVGNGSYRHGFLSTAVNDARGVAEALKDKGFAVVEVFDADKPRLEAGLQRAVDALKGKGGIGLFYYAGHGLQMDRRNYIVPIDLEPASAADIRGRALDVQQVIDAFMRAGSRASVVVLDACRNNPFSTRVRTSGLAPTDAAPGTLIAYAAAPGRLVADSAEQGPNSRYAHHLIAELRGDSENIEDVFKRVRLRVRMASGGDQVPWARVNLVDDIRLDGQAGSPDADAGAKLAAVDSDLASEVELWEKTRTSKSPDDYYRFLMKYPSGLVSEIAQFHLDRLQKPRAAAPVDPSMSASLPSGVDRYRVGDVLVYDRVEFLKKRRRRLEVVAIDGGRVTFGSGGGVRDQMGSILENRFGVKNPGIVFTPSELSLGKRWRTAFTNTNPKGGTSLNYWDSRVVALEDVTVPAGTFRAYRIERVGQARYFSKTTEMSGTTWVDPATMLEVKHIGRFSVGGRVTESWSDELVDLVQVPRPGN